MSSSRRLPGAMVTPRPMFVAFITLACLTAAPAAAQTLQNRDAQGRRGERVVEDGGTYRRHDAQGRTIGREVPDRDGGRRLYDAQGRPVGRVERRGDRWTERDAQGRVTGRTDRAGDRWIERDAQGRIVGRTTVEGGRLTHRDAQGRIVGRGETTNGFQPPPLR